MPAPSKSRKLRQIEPPIRHAGRDQDAARAQPRAVGERDDPDAFVDPETSDVSRHGDARAEALRLQQRVAGQFGAGDASREAEIVLDPRAGACLASRRQAFEDDDIQTFGGAVDRCSEPRGTGTDDDQIVHLGRIESRCPGRRSWRDASIGRPP